MNSVIDNWPFELHLPGYEYNRPSIILDFKLSKSIKSINKSDEAKLILQFYTSTLKGYYINLKPQ